MIDCSSFLFFLSFSLLSPSTVSQCPTLTEPNAPLSLRLEGIKLGQRAIYRCPMGYILQGTANATCLASGARKTFPKSFKSFQIILNTFNWYSTGNWSSPAPTCLPIQCPPLFLEDPHLSLIELNTSAWGRAVFNCKWGYRLSGPPNLECLASGHWSGPIPRCRGRLAASDVREIPICCFTEAQLGFVIKLAIESELAKPK